MNTRKVVVTAEVRKLLEELAVYFDQFGKETAQLADPQLETPKAVSIGANRESTKAQILGCAWRLHQASVRPRGGKAKP